ncbi:MAG: hypothetical protein CM15mP46_6870 [Alphaproteobacteria bacterium]|nr:MAG: hypothetical protein CM15mP46_6870 [Alphaproteobacteria bacterium]
MMTAVDKPALFHVAGDTLSKTQPAKIDLSDSPLWHRWLQPLWAVKQTLPAVFDNADITDELATIDRGDAPVYRAKLLTVAAPAFSRRQNKNRTRFLPQQ